MDYIKNRLQEPSTWRGLIWCISAFNVYSMNNDQMSAAIALAMALSGSIGVVAPDQK